MNALKKTGTIPSRATVFAIAAMLMTAYEGLAGYYGFYCADREWGDCPQPLTCVLRQNCLLIYNPEYDCQVGGAYCDNSNAGQRIDGVQNPGVCGLVCECWESGPGWLYMVTAGCKGD